MSSEALGVNDAGQVVGDSDFPNSYDRRTFLWTPGGTEGPPSNPEMRDIGTLGDVPVYAGGIDNAGRVVGQSYTKVRDRYGDEVGHAFVWTPGGTDGVPGNPQMRDLTPGWHQYSGATAVSASGVIVGDVVGGDYHREAVKWGARLHRLGGLGGRYSHAAAVSSDARVVGDATLPLWKGLPYAIHPYSFPSDHAFLWDGSMHDLGAPPRDYSAATGVNAMGQVVVTSNYFNYIWRQGQTTSLDRAIGPNWRIYGGGGINDRGQVVGQAVSDTADHAFLLSPYSICGKVLLKRRGLPGVRVTVGSSTVVTAADGTYIAPIPDSGTYKVIPEAANTRFSPAFQSVTATPCAGPIDFAATK